MCSVQSPCLHNAAYDHFTGVHAGSVKAPDYSLRPRFIKYPSIVLECGWSEFFPRLRIHKNRWIRGSDGHIRLVFLIKWNKLREERVSGVIKVWAGDATANDRLIQTEVIANLSSTLFKNSAYDS